MERFVGILLIRIRGGRFANLAGLTMFLITLLAGSQGLTKEGFEHRVQTMPSALTKVWDATLLFDGTKPSGKIALGTAVIVGSLKSENAVYALLSNHILTSVCPRLGPCPEAHFRRDYALRLSDASEAVSAGNNPTNFTHVTVVATSELPDLALVKIEFESGTTLRPISFTKECRIEKGQRVFSVGYPNLLKRTHHTIRLPNVGHLIKRWSSGIALDPIGVRYGDSTPVTMQDTTLDAVQGSSGSAVVNDKGEMIGVVDSFRVTNDFRFTGSDDNKQGHAFSIPCEEVQQFLRKHL